MAFELTSTSFMHEHEVPQSCTCEGEDLSPPLSWSGAPGQTQSFALIVDDPDAPDPAHPKLTWVHWLVYNIPAGARALDEHATAATLPPGAREGVNDWKNAEYGGPCPPIGRHRYYFKLFALDTVLPDLNKPDRATLEEAMKGHVLAQATLMGTYAKKQP